MIGIIDYGMGNLRSVQKALQLVEAEAEIVRTAEEVGAVDKLVLPGVGAFADGMEHLRRRGLIEPINGFIATGKPFLGICLGMQLIFEGSEEDAPSPDELVPGLGVLRGEVRQFRGEAYGPGKLKVPHMGWNALSLEAGNALFAGLSDGDHVYFVHSFYAQPADDAAVSARADYGGPFCAAVWRENVWATQFHPEKSQRVGLMMLRNFAGM